MLQASHLVPVRDTFEGISNRHECLSEIMAALVFFWDVYYKLSLIDLVLRCQIFESKHLLYLKQVVLFSQTKFATCNQALVSQPLRTDLHWQREFRALLDLRSKFGFLDFSTGQCYLMMKHQ